MVKIDSTNNNVFIRVTNSKDTDNTPYYMYFQLPNGLDDHTDTDIIFSKLITLMNTEGVYTVDGTNVRDTLFSDFQMMYSNSIQYYTFYSTKDTYKFIFLTTPCGIQSLRPFRNFPFFVTTDPNYTEGFVSTMKIVPPNKPAVIIKDKQAFVYLRMNLVTTALQIGTVGSIEFDRFVNLIDVNGSISNYNKYSNEYLRLQFSNNVTDIGFSYHLGVFFGLYTSKKPTGNTVSIPDVVLQSINYESNNFNLGTTEREFIFACNIPTFLYFTYNFNNTIKCANAFTNLVPSLNNCYNYESAPVLVQTSLVNINERFALLRFYATPDAQCFANFIYCHQDHGVCVTKKDLLTFNNDTKLLHGNFWTGNYLNTYPKLFHDRKFKYNDQCFIISDIFEQINSDVTDTVTRCSINNVESFSNYERTGFSIISSLYH